MAFLPYYNKKKKNMKGRRSEGNKKTLWLRVFVLDFLLPCKNTKGRRREGDKKTLWLRVFVLTFLLQSKNMKGRSRDGDKKTLWLRVFVLDFEIELRFVHAVPAALRVRCGIFGFFPD
jgi:hypothetical protein